MSKFTLLFSATFLFLAAAIQAQVQVNLQMAKKNYLKGESVQCVVTLTNRTGGDLLLHSSPGESIGWLNFSLSKNGHRLTPFKQQLFRAAKVPMGKSVSKTVDLSRFYSVREEGNFSVSVVIRTTDKQQFGSNRVHFNVSKGSTMLARRVGIPGKTNQIREYRLISFTSQDRTRLHFQVANAQTGVELSSSDLGESLMIHKPQAQIDGKNFMHVLYMKSPSVFGKVTFDYNGKFYGQTLYKRGQASAPRLVAFEDGSVNVAGGVVYDPEKEREKRATTHGISERPNVGFGN